MTQRKAHQLDESHGVEGTWFVIVEAGSPQTAIACPAEHTVGVRA